MDYHVIVFVLIALYWVGVGIVRFFRWIAKQATAVTAGPAPMQQAMAEARQQQALPQQAIPQPQQAAPRQTPRVPLRSRSPWEMPRQPDAGNPAVLREADRRDFERQESELLTEEPAALNARLQSETAPAASPPLRLFESSDDLVRAFILREALGPPKSRQSR